MVGGVDFWSNFQPVWSGVGGLGEFGVFSLKLTGPGPKRKGLSPKNPFFSGELLVLGSVSQNGSNLIWAVQIVKSGPEKWRIIFSAKWSEQTINNVS